MTELKKIKDYVWEVPKEEDMLVPGRIYAGKTMLIHLKEEEKTDWSS